MSALYKLGKRQILNGAIDLLTDPLRLVLLGSGYTFSDTQQFLSEIGSPVRVATSGLLSSKSITADGAFDAADVTFSTIAVGKTIIGAAIYKDTGAEASSTLICFLDGSVELPLFTAGTDVTIQFNNNINRIFKLG